MNELIAEFMGVPQGKHTHFMVEPFALESYADVDDLKYDASWDWLMPVVEKVFILSEDEEAWRMDIESGLTTLNINETYRAVVEFINEYNKNK